MWKESTDSSNLSFDAHTHTYTGACIHAQKLKGRDTLQHCSQWGEIVTVVITMGYIDTVCVQNSHRGVWLIEGRSGR